MLSFCKDAMLITCEYVYFKKVCKYIFYYYSYLELQEEILSVAKRKCASTK